MCDACILIETTTGRSIVARVVTYGVEQEAGDIDVSPSVFEALSTDEYPRSMTWTFARCPEAGNLQYEFQTEANIYWTSLWVRNPRVPIEKVEVKSANNPDFLNFCLLIHQAAMNMIAARNASTVPPSGAGAGAVRPGRGGYSWVFWVR